MTTDQKTVIDAIADAPTRTPIVRFVRMGAFEQYTEGGRTRILCLRESDAAPFTLATSAACEDILSTFNHSRKLASDIKALQDRVMLLAGDDEQVVAARTVLQLQLVDLQAEAKALPKIVSIASADPVHAVRHYMAQAEQDGE